MGGSSIHHTCLSTLSGHCSCPEKGGVAAWPSPSFWPCLSCLHLPQLHKSNPLQQLSPVLKTDMIMRASSGQVFRRNKSWLSPTMLIGPKGLAQRVGEQANLNAEIPANLNNFRQKTKQSAVGSRHLKSLRQTLEYANLNKIIKNRKFEFPKRGTQLVGR